jgi:phospholipase B1
MKFFLVIVAIFTVFVRKTHALDADDYEAYIEQLSLNEKFVEDYAKWSFKLFSKPDYLYGNLHNEFPCPIDQKPGQREVPTSVHKLQPSDIKCVGALGDSLTAGLGAHAITPVGLVYESRGVSWSVGGDHTYKKVLSLPNSLREYNPDLKGYSTKTSTIFLKGQNATHNGLNVAKSGDRSYHMPDQARLLLERIKSGKFCDWENDWKVITFFVGGNDLCSFCEPKEDGLHSPEQYMGYVRDTLDILYNASLPRTFINLVPVLDVRGVKDLNSGGPVCELLHKRTCNCAAFPTDNISRILDDYVPQYQQILVDLINTKRYDVREDFTVVVQPFLTKTQLPRLENHDIDFSYFAPDCFHFSGKGHAVAALSLWNNMLEPIGAKQSAWHIGETQECPTVDFPYFFTAKNSPPALEAYKRRTAAVRATPSKPTERASTSHSTERVSTVSTPRASTSRHHHQHKDRTHHKSDSKWTFGQKMKYAAFTAFFLMFLIILIMAATRRQQIRVFINGAGRHRLAGLTNPQYPDDSDDVEIWTRPGKKPAYSDNEKNPSTLGTRISFE